MSGSHPIDATRYFSVSTALQMAEAAEIAYAEPEVVEQTVLRRWRWSQICFLDVEGTQCFVAGDAENILVCFRGTEVDCVEDWIVDLDFDLVEGPCQGRVHEGFYDSLSRVWHLLDREVNRLSTDARRRLWVTGHSLGAALATLAVARWCDLKRPVSGLYTFGQPRTGDSKFARNFDFAFRPHAFRIVNNRDIVTRTPPRSLGYRHLGTFIYLNDSGELTCDIGWWRRFLEGWHGAIDTILDWGREGIEDHSMKLYRQLLASAKSVQSGRQFAASTSAVPFPDAAANVMLTRPRRRAA